MKHSPGNINIWANLQQGKTMLLNIFSPHFNWLWMFLILNISVTFWLLCLLNSPWNSNYWAKKDLRIVKAPSEVKCFRGHDFYCSIKTCNYTNIFLDISNSFFFLPLLLPPSFLNLLAGTVRWPKLKATLQYSAEYGWAKCPWKQSLIWFS